METSPNATFNRPPRRSRGTISPSDTVRAQRCGQSYIVVQKEDQGGLGNNNQLPTLK